MPLLSHAQPTYCDGISLPALGCRHITQHKTLGCRGVQLQVSPHHIFPVCRTLLTRDKEHKHLTHSMKVLIQTVTFLHFLYFSLLQILVSLAYVMFNVLMRCKALCKVCSDQTAPTHLLALTNFMIIVFLVVTERSARIPERILLCR